MLSRPEYISNLIETTVGSSNVRQAFNGSMYVDNRPSKVVETPRLDDGVPPPKRKKKAKGKPKGKTLRVVARGSLPLKLNRLKHEGDESNLMFDFMRRRIN